MQRKKAVRITAAVMLMITFIISLPFSSKADGELTYSEAVAAFKEDMTDPTYIDSVSSAYLYCVSTETELLSFDKSTDTHEVPADTAKLLTALTAYDLIDALSPNDIESDLSETVTITQRMIDDSINLKMTSTSTNVRFGYVRGNKVTYRDLLRTLLMRTANDSAVAIAYSLCNDNMSAFAEKMNEKAAEIGLTGSHFTNALGAPDENMYTTAKDVFILANEFYKNKTLMGFVGKRLLYLDTGKSVFSNNLLVSEYYSPFLDKKDYRDSSVNGMIVGSSDHGDVIVRSANYNGYEYICVVLGAKKRVEHFVYSYEVSGELIKWGSKNYSFLKILSTREPVASIPVISARETDMVPIVPSDDFSKYTLNNAYESGKLVKEITLNSEKLKAPVAKGTEVGEISIYYDGELVAKSTLRTAFELTENTTSAAIQLVWETISSKKAINVYITVVACVAVYVLINSIIRHRRKVKRDGAA